MSVVAFCDADVYKMKKSIAFPFCDLSTVGSRLADAHQEVALNARLAPDVYEGVVDITDEGGVVIDHAVRMRRLDDATRLAVLVTDGSGDECVVAVAHALGRFHISAERPPEAIIAAGRDQFAELWEAGFEQWHRFVGDLLPAEPVQEIERLARRFLSGREALFDARIRAGHAVDGHGDLLADDIFCASDGPRIIDCLEFDPRLRHGDTLLDAAFLAMDLEALGRPDLGERFLREYRSFTDDDWPPSLQHHFIAYRAHVRTKVAGFRAEQGDTPSDVEAARDVAIERLRLCVDHLRKGRVRLVLIGGLPGTGKSTVAADLARRRGCALLRSDEIRKVILGLPADERHTAGFGEGIYGNEHTERTYGALLSHAGELLSRGESVVLDATWNRADRRAGAQQVAAATDADLVELICEAPAPLCRNRLNRRSGAQLVAATSDPSDATVEIHDEMQRRFAPWPNATPIDTSGPAEDAAAKAVVAFDA